MLGDSLQWRQRLCPQSPHSGKGETGNKQVNIEQIVSGSSAPRKYTAGFGTESIMVGGGALSDQVERKACPGGDLEQSAEPGGRNKWWGHGGWGRTSPTRTSAMGFVPPMASVAAKGPGHVT